MCTFDQDVLSCAFCPQQAIINSTITPNMTFTKTSQKFGQWADSRANTVYGLGFSSESHLVKVRNCRCPTETKGRCSVASRAVVSVASVTSVCREVCRVQGGGTVSQGEVSGEDGAHQHALSGNRH